jgi:hypothetical protein
VGTDVKDYAHRRVRIGRQSGSQLDDPTLRRSAIGDRTLKSSASVWKIMCTEWCRICLT